MKKLEWNVLNYDFNKRKSNYFNVFYSGFDKELKKEIQDRNIKTRLELKDFIDCWARYNYWGRTEYEIYIGDLCSTDKELDKISVYQQIKINLDRIVDYLILSLSLKLENKVGD